MDRPLRSALVLAIDDAEPFDAVRRDFARASVARGIPFHVTLLYPFAPRDELNEALLDDVGEFFGAEQALGFALTRLATWPTIVYAIPEPDRELVRCMRALHARYPQWPPYNGVHAVVVPHATLAADVDAAAVRGEIEGRLAPHLPRHCSFGEVTLLEEFAPDRWCERTRMPLGR